MTNEKQDIPVLIKVQFAAALHYEIERVTNGAKSDWEGNGLHKRLLLEEARKLVRTKAHTFESLKLDPEKAQAYLVDYPEALERQTFPVWVPLKRAIVDAVEQVILDRVFDQEHKAIVIQQWNKTRAEDVLKFVVEAASKYKRLTGRTIGYRSVADTPDDLEALAATVFELREGFYNENMDYEHLDEVRRADEYLEFLEFVKAGEISLDAVLGQENGMGMVR